MQQIRGSICMRATGSRANKRSNAGFGRFRLIGKYRNLAWSLRNCTSWTGKHLALIVRNCWRSWRAEEDAAPIRRHTHSAVPAGAFHILALVSLRTRKRRVIYWKWQLENPTPVDGSGTSSLQIGTQLRSRLRWDLRRSGG